MTERRPVVEQVHGVTITDPYRWLEDKNSPETRAWILQQISYTEGLLRQLPGEEALRQRLTRLMDLERTTVPKVRGRRHFYLHRPPGVEQERICLREGVAGQPEVLVDPNSWSADRMTSVTLVDVSRDGKLLAYGIREGGEDEYIPVLWDVEARRERGRLPKRRYLSLDLHPDQRRVFYGLMTEGGPRIFVQGVEGGAAEEVFGAGYGPDHWINVHLSEDGRWALYEVQKGWERAWLFLDDLEARGEPRLLTAEAEGLFESVVAGEQVFVRTNWGAPNWRVFSFRFSAPELVQWREVIREGASPVEKIHAAAGRLVVARLVNASFRVALYQPDGSGEREIPLPELGTIEELGGDWKGEDIFFEYTSFLIPPTVYRVRAAAGGAPRTWSRQAQVVKREEFAVRQLWFTSKDGTRVPLFLLARKGLAQDGSAPALLYGYGGFNVAITPEYSAAWAAFVERGGVVAVANLRGGSEFGEQWHRAGMREQKQNVFDDFVAAADFLIRENYTSAQRLAIYGGSNGGLLVGAALTQRPELFRAVICAVPLLDMVRYHRFLLGMLWTPEYGSAEEAEQFRYLYAYSPYHRVEEGRKYPAVMFVTGDADTRVDPLHARKMTALLQHASTSGLPVLLHYDLKVGHTRSLPVSKRVRDTTDILQFLFWQLGMIAPGEAPPTAEGGGGLALSRSTR